jgi:hypothetical protein
MECMAKREYSEEERRARSERAKRLLAEKKIGASGGFAKAAKQKENTKPEKPLVTQAMRKKAVKVLEQNLDSASEWNQVQSARSLLNEARREPVRESEKESLIKSIVLKLKHIAAVSHVVGVGEDGKLYAYGPSWSSKPTLRRISEVSVGT